LNKPARLLGEHGYDSHANQTHHEHVQSYYFENVNLNMFVIIPSHSPPTCSPADMAAGETGNAPMGPHATHCEKEDAKDCAARCNLNHSRTNAQPSKPQPEKRQPPGKDARLPKTRTTALHLESPDLHNLTAQIRSGANRFTWANEASIVESTEAVITSGAAISDSTPPLRDTFGVT